MMGCDRSPVVFVSIVMRVHLPHPQPEMEERAHALHKKGAASH